MYNESPNPRRALPPWLLTRLFNEATRYAGKDGVGRFRLALYPSRVVGGNYEERGLRGERKTLNPASNTILNNPTTSGRTSEGMCVYINRKCDVLHQVLKLPLKYVVSCSTSELSVSYVFVAPWRVGQTYQQHQRMAQTRLALAFFITKGLRANQT